MKDALEPAVALSVSLNTSTIQPVSSACLAITPAVPVQSPLLIAHRARVLPSLPVFKCVRLHALMASTTRVESALNATQAAQHATEVQ